MNKSDKPKQYVQGWVEFFKLKFKVTPDVLIPRPETELLVEMVLKAVHSSQLTVHSQTKKDYVATDNRKRSLRLRLEPRTDNQYTILDVGTGSGNIAISLAKNLPNPTPGVGYRILATDVSEKALKVAGQNAKLHGVKGKIEFIQSDLLSNVIPNLIGNPKNIDPRFRGDDKLINDNLIIVTNLPYIPFERIAYLDSSVKDFEPHVALDGGDDGFELYRKLFLQLQKLTHAPRGWDLKLLVGEIDYTHGEIGVYEAQKYFPQARVEVKLDLAHRQRILVIST